MVFGSEGASYVTDQSRRRRAGRSALGVALLASLTLLFLNRSGPLESSRLRTGMEDVTAPVMSYMSMPLRGVETWMDSRRERELAFAENQTLRAEVERLRDVERERDELARKLDAMRLHTAMPPVDGHRLVLARAVSETGGAFRRAALLNAGRAQGVRAGSAVMSTNGLYGHVLRVGERSSRVLRLTDLSSRIAVKSERTGARALLTGDDGPRPRLGFLDAPEDFAPGDAVLTSGDEGVLPENLYVGTVGEEGRVNLAETGRTADWVRIYVRSAILAPEPPEGDAAPVVRIVEVPVPVAPPEREPGAGSGAEGAE